MANVERFEIAGFTCETGGILIKELDEAEITIPKGVDRQSYKQQLKFEVDYRTTARKSTKRKRKRFGKKTKGKKEEKPKKSS